MNQKVVTQLSKRKGRTVCNFPHLGGKGRLINSVRAVLSFKCLVRKL